MSVWGALAGGLVGAVVFSSGLRARRRQPAWTRMDIPLLLGSILTEDRSRARAIGYGLQLLVGLGFSLVYAAIFAAVGLASWWFGLLLGAVHAGLFGGPLTNVVLPALHPRMGKAWTDATDTPLLEPPGFLLGTTARARSP